MTTNKSGKGGLQERKRKRMGVGRSIQGSTVSVKWPLKKQSKWDKTVSFDKAGGKTDFNVLISILLIYL